MSFGCRGGCLDLIMAGFDNGAWLEVGGDELKKFRPWRFREKQKERGRKNKK